MQNIFQSELLHSSRQPPSRHHKACYICIYPNIITANAQRKQTESTNCKQNSTSNGQYRTAQCNFTTPPTYLIKWSGYTSLVFTHLTTREQLNDAAISVRNIICTHLYTVIFTASHKNNTYKLHDNSICTHSTVHYTSQKPPVLPNLESSPNIKQHFYSSTIHRLQIFTGPICTTLYNKDVYHIFYLQ